MSSTLRPKKSTKRNRKSPGHLYKIGQRVKRKQNVSGQMLFGEARQGTIIDLTWTQTQSGSRYPTYAVKFDHSTVVDRSVHQMRLIPID